MQKTRTCNNCGEEKELTEYKCVNQEQGWYLENYQEGCAVTGMEFIEEYQPGHPKTPHIDRIDAGGPYTKENCRLVTKQFNKIKSDISDEELYKNSKSFIECYES